MKLNRRTFSTRSLLAGMSGLAAPHLVSAQKHTESIRLNSMQSEASQIIVGQTQEPTKFHPLGTRIEVDEAVHYQLFDMLWVADENGDLLPSLALEVPTAENGGISEDGLTWTVNLRDDVLWHDGTAFSANDVRFSWELVMSDDFIPRTRQGFDRIVSMKVESPTQVSWTMSEPYAPLLSVWAISPIVPEHILEDYENPNEGPFSSNPVGTGPFKWKERIAGDRITLEANPDYFRDGPFVETLVFKYVPDTTSFFAQFRTGEIDHTGIQGITAEHYETAMTLEDRQIHEGLTSSIEGLGLNMSRPQFQDIAVRQAMYLAMDKQQIIESIYYNLPIPTESFLFQGSWAYNSELEAHEYNPDLANQLLEEAGWIMGDDGVRSKDGVRLSFLNSTTTGNAVREQTQVYLQQTWAEVGIELQINNMPPAVMWGDYYLNSEFDTVIVGNVYGIGSDPDISLQFHSKSAAGSQGTNVFMINDPDLDTLLDEGVAALDREARLPIYREIQSLIRQQHYMLPIFQYARIEGSKNGLSGYVPNPNYRTNRWNLNTWEWE